MRFIWGIIGIIIGVLIVRYTFPLVNFFGRVSWAERHLSWGSAGGTYTLYKIIGVGTILLSGLYMFGLLEVLLWPILKIFAGPGQR